VGKLDVDALVTVGPDGDPSAVGPLPDSVRVERFVSQGVLLPYVDAVSHHGGSGTMLGALSHGLPQLVLPRGADQFFNAQALVDSGTGCCLTPEENTPETVREASKGYSANRDTGSPRVGSPTRSRCRPPRRRSRNRNRSRLDRWASAEAVTALGHGADRSRRSEALSAGFAPSHPSIPRRGSRSATGLPALARGRGLVLTRAVTRLTDRAWVLAVIATPAQMEGLCRSSVPGV
jgi:hypothetical protein